MGKWLQKALDVDVAGPAAAVLVAAVEEAGRQADRLLGSVPPRPGTAEWDVEQDGPDPGRELAWQLVQFRIDLAVGIDPIPNLVGLRRGGVTWDMLAKAAGITRQSAHERWARPVLAVLDRYGTGELGGPVAADDADR